MWFDAQSLRTSTGTSSLALMLDIPSNATCGETTCSVVPFRYSEYAHHQIIRALAEGVSLSCLVKKRKEIKHYLDKIMWIKL